MNALLYGPLIQHAVDHLALGGDFDRRVAMVSIDNAVELTIKTYLGLPKRARGSEGPGRKDLEAASESFPGLLDLSAPCKDFLTSSIIKNDSLVFYAFPHLSKNFHLTSGLTNHVGHFPRSPRKTCPRCS